MNFVVFLHRTFPRFIFWMARFGRANYEEEMNLLDLLCQPHTLSIDVGAKVGMYTYRIVKYSKAVWAFEPIPELANLLRKQFGRQVHVEGVALSDQSRRATLRIPFTSKRMPRYGLSTIEPANTLNSPRLATVREVDVDVRRLDDFQIANIGFMKIDVEGHELAVVKGARESLRRCHPTLLIEANDQYHPGAVLELMVYLEGLDYEGHFIHDGVLSPIRSVTAHFHDKGIENFVFIPNSNVDLKQQIVARLKSAKES
jgi:FkbM family methyltransferase